MKNRNIQLILFAFFFCSPIYSQELFWKGGPSFNGIGDLWGFYNDVGFGIRSSKRANFQFSITQTNHKDVFPLFIQDTTGTFFTTDEIIDSEIRRQIIGIELNANCGYRLIDLPKFKFRPSIGLNIRRQVIDYRSFFVGYPPYNGLPVPYFYFVQNNQKFVEYTPGVKVQLEFSFRISPKQWYITTGMSGQMNIDGETLWNFPIGISKTLRDND